MAYDYPFDPTGSETTNRITGEQIAVLAPGDRKFHFAVPRFSPFFEEGLVVHIKDINNVTTPLTKGVDFYLSHKYMDASLATMHPIWGSISFLKRDIIGTLIISYNTLGGMWTLDTQGIADIAVNQLINPRINTWENVTERPVDFPVINHPWNLDDMVGQKEILDVLESFYNDWLTTIDINSGGMASLENHINNFNNPHQVTASQVGAYSKTEITNILTGYLKTTGTANNSNKFDNKTYTQVFADVVTTKVNNAFNADNTGYADESGNSNSLGGKTLAQLLLDISNMTVANATKFNNKTYQQMLDEVKTVVVNNATNSKKLGGLTLTEIINEITVSASTNALTVEGKTLAQIMLDVISVKVTNAFNADNTNLLDGNSLSDIINIIKNNVETSWVSSDSSKAYGYTFPELKNALSISNNHFEVDLSKLETEYINISGSQSNLEEGYYYFNFASMDFQLNGSINNKIDPIGFTIFINNGDTTIKSSFSTKLDHLQVSNDNFHKHHNYYFGNSDINDFSVGYLIEQNPVSGTVYDIQTNYILKIKSHLRNSKVFIFNDKEPGITNNLLEFDDEDDVELVDHTSNIYNEITFVKNKRLIDNITLDEELSELTNHINSLLGL